MSRLIIPMSTLIAKLKDAWPDPAQYSIGSSGWCRRVDRVKEILADYELESPDYWKAVENAVRDNKFLQDQVRMAVMDRITGAGGGYAADQKRMKLSKKEQREIQHIAAVRNEMEGSRIWSEVEREAALRR